MMMKPRRCNRRILAIGVAVLLGSGVHEAYSAEPNPVTAYKVILKGHRSVICRSVETLEKNVFCMLQSHLRIGLPRSSVLRIEKVLADLPEKEEPDRSTSDGAQTSSPGRPEVLLPKGEQDLVSKMVRDYQAAIRGDKKPSGKASASELHHRALQIALVYLPFRDWHHAEYWLDQADRWQAGDADVLYWRAWMALQQHRPAEARQWAESGLKNRPDDFDTLVLLGDIAREEDQLDETIRFWSMALQVREDATLEQRLAGVIVKNKRMGHYRERTTRHFNIRYSDQISEELEGDLVSILESAYRKITRVVHLQIVEPIPVRVYTRTDYRTLLKTPDWSGAAYDGIVHIPIRGFRGNPAVLEKNVRHELCHALITQHSQALAPPWFQEGMAQQCGMIGHTEELEESFQRIARRKAVPPAVILQASSFGGFSGPQALVLYRTSFAWVTYLQSRYGRYNILQFLNAMADGHPWEEAFESAFGRPFPLLYEAWRHRL